MTPSDVMSAPGKTQGPELARPELARPELARPELARPARPTTGENTGRARPRRAVRVLVISFLCVGILAAGLAAFVMSRGGYYRPLETLPAVAATKLDIKPQGVYVIVDTHANRLRVYKDGQLLREAVCSTGSGTVLKDPRNGKTWIFDTPNGERKVLRKTRDPIWYKPDWAFIEEGQLPPRNQADRMDDISLGKYGLYMGDGYIIHGTIFQSLLGQSLTHGCVRLGDDDLEFVFKNVPVGARVFLY